MAPKKKANPKPKKPRFHRHLDTTIPVVKPCSVCGVWLAAGISEGLHTACDLTALDVTQQVLATFAGVRLYAITRTGLVELDRYRLTDPKFGGRFPRHRCGTVWESRLPGVGWRGFGAPSDAPPF